VTDSDDYLLVARNLHKSYRNGSVVTPVLRGLDLSVRRGELLVIMGPSGCGKSTLLHVLGMMLTPTHADRLELAGVDALGLSDRQRTACRRGRIGFVFQRFNLLPVLSVRENVRLAQRLRGQSPDGLADELLGEVGLQDKGVCKPGRLSVGEQQRAAIARALACRPALLLADEPTGNLDSANADRVIELLARLHRQYGQTTVMITHNADYTTCADRVLHMTDGRIVE
jgi:putative ABC transport system ATP-binding protein